jgi:hypothetical protein
MGKNLCSRVVPIGGILACLVLSISIPANAAPPALISDSGQKLSSVFDGLTANPRLANYQPVLPLWRGMLQGRLPGLRNVNIIYGNNCPGAPCAGNYEVIVSSGGCMATGCDNPQNVITDTQNGSCSDGAINSECGGGDTGPCCAMWDNCPSPNTIGCHN